MTLAPSLQPSIAPPGQAASAFALFFGNRGFFPGHLIAGAREELARVLNGLGHQTLMPPIEGLNHGAVETAEEGRRYAAWLESQRGRFAGVILCLPNFGDENGAVAALRDARVPILIQAYPDELGQMGPGSRRDAFCGKMSIMDVFCQHRIPFTALTPHAVAPTDARFAANIAHFDRICRVVRGLGRCVIGALGARTTAFKTVRVDELALQRKGVTVETVDLSGIIARVQSLSATDPAVAGKRAFLASYADHSRVPAEARDNLARLGVVFDQVVAEMGLDGVAVRCWMELQQQLGISPCVLVSAMNHLGLPTACEVDVANAVMMHALRLSSGDVTTLLDWNNNFADQDDKCILFHCGPVPQKMMAGRGEVVDHALLQPVLGEGRSWGPTVGRIAPTLFTYGGLLTEDGGVRCYVGEGRFTDDQVPADFFGCAGVAQIPRLQQVLAGGGRGGHRHHVALTPSHVAAPLREALASYLGYQVQEV
jgi:L-fucose isomerase-like protein